MPGAFSAHLLGTHRIAMVRSVSRHIRYVPIAQLRYVHPGPATGVDATDP